MPGVIFLDSFSGDLSDLKPKQRTVANALLVLRDSPRVSTWDMDKQWLRSMIRDLEGRKFIIPKAEGYPWLRWEISDAGMQFLRSNKEVRL
jgi:hypothetical protein